MPCPLSAAAAANPADDILARLAEFKTISSSDSSVRVTSGTYFADDRQTVLLFVEDVRSRLESLFDTSFRENTLRVTVIINNPGGDGEFGGESASAVLLTSYVLGSAPTARIEINGFDALDPRDLTRELCAGFLNVKIMALWEKTVRVPRFKFVLFPKWFTDGVARHLEVAIRQADADETVSLWQNGGLPPFWQLVSTNAPPSEAVGATLAAYWLSQPERKARFEALCSRLSAGFLWKFELFAGSLFPERYFDDGGKLPTPNGADRAFDTWLLERRDTILTVGTTPDSLPARAWRMLLLFPGEDHVPADSGIPPGSPPSVLIGNAGQKWAKDCAAAKNTKLVRYAAGRGEAFQDAARAYAEFFAALAKGESALELQGKLVRAEVLLFKSER